ncbi:hypothetical protein [Nocardiopsis synnemataformans]|uniref:hypothetical protein n=1 Tax=Nocardiopsis synnemataformans TaxID=61305 RepID=UPI003EBAFF7E
MSGAGGLTSGLSYAPVLPPRPWETALARATVALAAPDDRDDRRELLAALGLDLPTGGPRIRLAALEWRPDLSLRREPTAPAATAPVSPEVLRSREAAKRRRREAATAHLRAQGLRGPKLRAALARLES